MLALGGSGLGLRGNSELHSPGLFQMLILFQESPSFPPKRLLLPGIFDAELFPHREITDLVKPTWGR